MESANMVHRQVAVVIFAALGIGLAYMRPGGRPASAPPAVAQLLRVFTRFRVFFQPTLAIVLFFFVRSLAGSFPNFIACKRVKYSAIEGTFFGAMAGAAKGYGITVDTLPWVITQMTRLVSLMNLIAMSLQLWEVSENTFFIRLSFAAARSILAVLAYAYSLPQVALLVLVDTPLIQVTPWKSLALNLFRHVTCALFFSNMRAESCDWNGFYVLAWTTMIVTQLSISQNTAKAVKDLYERRLGRKAKSE